MKLAKQKQKMLEDYYQSGHNILSEEVVTKVMIPLFEAIAKQLKCENVYFFADSSEHNFTFFVLQNPKNPQEIKQTMYF
ncbi:MAG: hypothetical protein ACO36E_07515, partial [Synechocystis sp.]